MIDGFKTIFIITCNRTIRRLLGLPCWEIIVNEKTLQRVDDCRRTSLRGLTVEFKPSENGGYVLIFNGSLHKWFNCGEHNADQFTFYQLLNTISGICTAFGIEAKEVVLQRLEVGVNIPLPFPPLRILKSVVCYKGGKPFTHIDRRNKRLGIVCTLSDYEIKMYDKQAQSGIDCGNVLRVELKIKKMRHIESYGIKTLNDLTDQSKVYPLSALLTNVLEAIIWTDTSVKLAALTAREQKQWLTFNNPASWDGLPKKQTWRNKKYLQILFDKYGEQQVKPVLKKCLSDTWERLFEAENCPPFHQPTANDEAQQLSTVSLLEYMQEKVDTERLGTEKHDASFSIINTNNITINKNGAKNAPMRCCKTCGRDIGNQRKQSSFCSEVLYGKAAKACRNKVSNHRRDIKLKINKAIQRQKNVRLAYTINGQSYTDTYHATDILVGMDWIAKITTIEILP